MQPASHALSLASRGPGNLIAERIGPILGETFMVENI
jgi:hypothetical protein